MALTVTLKDLTVVGNKKLSVFTIGFDSSYPTGGEPLSARNLGLSAIDFIMVEPAGGLLFEYDHANAKLMAMTPTVAHNHTITITGGVSGTVAIGISSDANGAALSKTAASDRTGITGIQNCAAAAATEVANGTDLSGFTDVRGFAFGV